MIAIAKTTSTLLIIQALLEGDLYTLRYKLLMIGFIWLLVSIGITIDFFSGVEKAKANGKFRSSTGFRLTVSKCKEYFGFLSFAFLFDCLVMMILTAFNLDPAMVLPFPTIISGAFLLRIEFKSFLEKASDKQKKALGSTIDDLVKLLENKDNISHGVVEILKDKIENGKDQIMVTGDIDNNISDGDNSVSE